MSTKREPIKCDTCGEFFIPRNSRQHSCCKKITRTCLVCGDQFETICSPNGKLVCDKPECKKLANQVSEPVERICKQCGNKFTTIFYKNIYCNEEKQKPCVICGKPIKYKCNSFIPETCSPICQAVLVKTKRRNNIANEIRICKWCGKEFHPKEVRDVYCEGPHFKKCTICGKEFEIDVRKDQNVETCSKECMGKLMAQNHDHVKSTETQRKNLMAKYGVTNVMQIPGVVDKIKKNNLEKYGKEWYTQTDQYKESVKESCQEKYGVDHHLKAKEVINKRISTVQEKYGVDNVFQSDQIKEQSKQTNLDKYGFEYVTQSDEIKEKIKNNNIDKYGVSHPMMLPEYKQKAIDTNIKLYGFRSLNQQHIKDIQKWYEFIDNPRQYIQSYYETSPRTAELAADLGVGPDTIDTYLGRSDSFDCVRRARSLMEEELSRYIRSTDDSIEVIAGSKSIIRPYELDLYLPQLKFAIECDPTCTHNSSVPFRNYDRDPTPPSYHKMKTDLCENQGISLLHIFGYDWSHKKDIILSMIKNRLGKCDRVVYARKCKVVEVSGRDSIKFLNENHRQGAANSPVRLGLVYEGELVSLMTFGKMRGTIGTGNEDLEDCWELVRFCSLLNTSVVGGASKLLKHFVKEYSPQRIRSFSDRAHTSGNLYATLGFKEVRRSDAGYVWVNVFDDIAYHRANAQKQNIKRFLQDDSIDLSKTEREIMIEHGFVQVFDSGTITWEWRK